MLTAYGLQVRCRSEDGSWVEMATVAQNDVLGEELWVRSLNSCVWAAQVEALGNAVLYELPNCNELQEALKKGKRAKKPLGEMVESKKEFFVDRCESRSSHLY